MLPNKILIWILVGTLVVSLCVIMALSLSTAHYYHLTCNLRIELNQTGQTVQQLKQEVENREKIMAEKEKLIEQVREAKTYSDYIKIWNDLNASLHTP